MKVGTRTAQEVRTDSFVFVRILRAQRIEQTKSDDAPSLNLSKCHDVLPLLQQGGAQSDTKNGPLVLKVSINAARELLAKLARLPPNLGFQSPAAKQS
jgi:hypothetical protein